MSKTRPLDRTMHHLTLATMYVAAARTAVAEGDRPFALGETSNAIRSMRDAAKVAAKFADALAGKRVSK